jgi:ankyrin repeat protein
MLEYSAFISEQNGHQRTALYFASAGGHIEAAEALFLHRADMPPVNKKEENILTLIINKDDS